MDIEGVISTFESQLRELGFTDDTGALLVQINIDGRSYIKSLGDLNHLTIPGVIIDNRVGRNFIDFMEKEIELANVSMSTKKLHIDTLRQLKAYKDYIDIRTVNSDFLLTLESYISKLSQWLFTKGRHCTDPYRIISGWLDNERDILMWQEKKKL